MHSIEEVLHCHDVKVVVSAEVNFGGPDPTTVYERYLFDIETGEVLGSAFDEESRGFRGLLPAAVVVHDLFLAC